MLLICRDKRRMKKTRGGYGKALEWRNRISALKTPVYVYDTCCTNITVHVLLYAATAASAPFPVSNAVGTTGHGFLIAS
jgi:hypothetical protein